MKKTQVLIFIGLLISIKIVLTQFLSIQTPIIRIGFGFIPIALSAIMFGPIWGGITAMLADIIGMLIFPQGAYFPGFTLSAFLGGLIYGLLLYKKPKTILRISIAVFIISLFVDLGLNTLWLSMITGKAAMALLMPRIIKTAIMLPIQIFSIHIFWQYVGSLIQLQFNGASK